MTITPNTVIDGAGSTVAQLNLGGANGGTVTPSFNGISATIPLTLTPAANAVITMNVPSTGNFTLTYTPPGGTAQSATGTIAQGASTTAVQNHLNTIPALSGNVIVTGASPNYIFTFVNALAQRPVGTFTKTTVSGNGGGSVSFANTTVGAVGSPTPAQVQASLNTIQGLAGNVAVIGQNGGPFKVVFGGNMSGELANTLAIAAQTGGTVATTSLDNTAVVSNNEVQKLTFLNTAGGTVITAGTTTFTISLPIGATGSNLTTLAIPYTNDPAQLAMNMQIALNRLLGGAPFIPNNNNTAVPTSSSDGIGNVLVTPLSATEFSLTFQSDMGRVNWPQVTVAVSNTGGGNVNVVPSTIFNGVGNELQTLVFGGSNNTTFQLQWNGVATNSQITFKNNDTATPSATALSNFIQTIPQLAGNVFVLGIDNGNNNQEGPFYILFNNQLSGFGGPLLNMSSPNTNNVTGAFASVAGAPGVTQNNAINPILLNGGLLGVGTDVLTTGGLTIAGYADVQQSRLIHRSLPKAEHGR